MAGGGSRRQPILEAMIRVAGSKGYRGTSVADVVADASASRATFYKYFGDKHDCFLAAYDVAVERTLAAARSRCDSRQSWQERVRAGLAAVVELFAGDAALARVAVVEIAAAGEDGQRRHWATIGRFADLLEDGPEEVGPPRLPPNTARMAIGGAVSLTLDELRAGRSSELRRVVPDLEFALLVPFVGPQAAIGQTDASTA